MSFFSYLRSQPEDVRRTILAVVMVVAGIAIGTGGIATIKHNVFGRSSDTFLADNTPLLIIANTFQQGVAGGREVFSEAGKGWSEAATLFQAWNVEQ
jgi:hypothetical protein